MADLGLGKGDLDVELKGGQVRPALEQRSREARGGWAPEGREGGRTGLDLAARATDEGCQAGLEDGLVVGRLGDAVGGRLQSDPRREHGLLGAAAHGIQALGRGQGVGGVGFELLGDPQGESRLDQGEVGARDPGGEGQARGLLVDQGLGHAECGSALGSLKAPPEV